MKRKKCLSDIKLKLFINNDYNILTVIKYTSITIIQKDYQHYINYL